MFFKLNKISLPSDKSANFNYNNIKVFFVLLYSDKDNKDNSCSLSRFLTLNLNLLECLLDLKH